MRVAIMQPYFIPYPGYFRLFAATDLFVIYDCVQFPRRGWVHRNQLTDMNGQLRWLTLPLEKAPQKTSINEIKFRKEFSKEMEELFSNFKIFKDPDFYKEELKGIREAILTPAAYLVDYLEQVLRQVCLYLNLPYNIVRSSSLKVHPDLHGQDRIIEICKIVGAKTYLNAPGGRSLYDQESFKKCNLELKFLSGYEGKRISILQSIVEKAKEEIVYAIES